MRKTAQDGDSAGELPEVTTEAHSQSTRDSEHSLDHAGDAESKRAPETQAAKPAEPDIDIEIEEPEGSLDNAASSTALSKAGSSGANRGAAPASGSSDAIEANAPAQSDASERGDAAHEAIRSDPSSQPAAAGNAESDSNLDYDEAERYAASFRPSWEPDFPVTPMIPPAQFVGTNGGAARVVRHSTRSDFASVRVRKHRGASYAIVSASLLGMGGLIYLAIASSSARPSAELARQREADRVETQIQAAHGERPAAVQPAAAETPEPPAAQPSAELAAVEEAPADAIDPNAVASAEPSMVAAPDPAADEQVGIDPNAVAAAAPTAAEPATTEAPGAAAASEVAAAAAAAAAPQPAAAAAPAAPAQAEHAAAAAPSPQPSAATTEAAPRPAERPAKVTLSLAAHPPTTRLRLDGAPIDNPYRARLPRSSVHRIEARAPGFAPEVHTVRLEADVQLMISLKREPTPDVKPDPYRVQRRNAAVQPAPTRSRGAGFVAENPY